MNSVKHRTGQMHLDIQGEWSLGVGLWSGSQVKAAANKCTEEWLAACKEERTLTMDMMSQIADVSNLSLACQRVISNGGSGGVDGMEVKELRQWFAGSHRSLASDLLSGTYTPSAVRGVKIPKPKGGYRQLGIPTVKDRLIQQAIAQVLIPRYERIFSDHSYGFRPGRGAHGALHQGSEYVRTGKSYIVDIDLAKFFDEVQHDRLMWLLSTRIGDSRVLQLIRKFLKSGLLEGGLLSQRIKGTPQGGPLSPLLSNIVLDELDKELERRGHNFVRYADDLIVFLQSERSAERVSKSLIDYIETQLGLRVNRAKSRLCRSESLNFLGHGILRDGQLMLSQSSEKRLKAKLRQVTRRNRGRSFKEVIGQVNRYLRGWLSYFRYARMKNKLRAIESWLKRRLRCYRLKQCKRAIGIYRWLHKLGVPKERSWTTASTRRGWWVKAISPASHEGMSNEWFRSIGLVELVATYTKLYV